MEFLFGDRISIYCDDVLNSYEKWPSPVAIISDGPYGINGFPGDLKTNEGLAEWYESHIINWTRMATPQTTLWFWNTELGWATVHPMLEKYGWEYKACNIWDKGLSHVAGNTNTKTLTKLPITTEVCVQYVKKPEFLYNGSKISTKEWLRFEWERTGLPFSKTNEACGVKDAATRKYFTKCHLWYMPPAEAFEKIVTYANNFGEKNGRPYFSINGVNSLSKNDWEKMRAKFYCPLATTNVWSFSQLNGKERLKNKSKAIHLNQKPLKLIEFIISICTDENDVVWDPFGGLCTTAIASFNLKRLCYSAEIKEEVFEIAKNRILTQLKQPEQLAL